MREIRLATCEDAKEMNQIYEYYILNSAATFEYEVLKDEEFAKRIQNILLRFPYLVYLIDGKIVGYAYLSTFKTRAAYQWDVEISVYVHKDYHKCNIATTLYECLIQFAKDCGYYNIYAQITDPNEKSKHFHEKCGFIPVGLYPNSGYKFNQWWGLNVMCKPIADFEQVPQTPKKFNQLAQAYVDSVIASTLNKFLK